MDIRKEIVAIVVLGTPGAFAVPVPHTCFHLSTLHNVAHLRCHSTHCRPCRRRLVVVVHRHKHARHLHTRTPQHHHNNYTLYFTSL
jgi:hypothetical protein